MHGGLLTPLFAALVIGLSGPNPISSAFACRPLLIVGESSYCLYLLHFNVSSSSTNTTCRSTSISPRSIPGSPTPS